MFLSRCVSLFRYLFIGSLVFVQFCNIVFAAEFPRNFDNAKKLYGEKVKGFNGAKNKRHSLMPKLSLKYGVDLPNICITPIKSFTTAKRISKLPTS